MSLSGFYANGVGKSGTIVHFVPIVHYCDIRSKAIESAFGKLELERSSLSRYNTHLQNIVAVLKRNGLSVA